jgi:hypothetical protein
MCFIVLYLPSLIGAVLENERPLFCLVQFKEKFIILVYNCAEFLFEIEYLLSPTISIGSSHT